VIGTGVAGQLKGVCKERFMVAYDMKRTYIEDISRDLHKGHTNTAKPLNDKTSLAALDVADGIGQLTRLALSHGIVLTRDQLAAIQIPNSFESVNCYGWMRFYFDMVGDQIPNSAGEIHLEPIWIKDIYAEYLECMQESNFQHLEPTQFAQLWKLCFPNVSIREFKAVTGKCETCSRLSDLRRGKRDVASRRRLTELHLLHRSMYMGERMAYAERIMLSLQLPSNFLSLISDGMAQTHSILPWCGNLTSFKKGCQQHIQGVAMHGRSLIMYRTFPNLAKSGSLQIHTFLLSLEQIVMNEGKLPDTVFYQIDGGSENTAKIVYVICELLIIRGLTKKVVLTRLVVGHTHADIDSVFGRLWTAIRNMHVRTPQEYAAMIAKTLSVFGKYDAQVVDLFVVPDYNKILGPLVDKNFGRYAKEDYTQLQFTFEAIEPSPMFPLGCRTTYRAYSRDEVIEIVQHEGSVLNLRPRIVRVQSQPTTDNVHGVSGV